MRAGAHEDDQALLAAVGEPVRQQKVAADMAFPMPIPVATHGMVEPFGPQRTVIGDQEQHGRLEPVHVVSARVRQALPVLEEGLGVVGGSRGMGTWLLKVPGSFLLPTMR